MSYYNYNQMMSNLYSPNTNTSTTPASGPYQYTPNQAPVTNYTPPSTGGPSMYVPPTGGGGKVLPNTNRPAIQIPATKIPTSGPPYQGADGGVYNTDDYAVHEVYDPVLHGGGTRGGRPTIGDEEQEYDNRGRTGGIYDFDYSDKQALKSLFSNLNRINLKDPRLLGGGSGGGSEALEGNMDPNRFISLNPYLDQNVTSFNYGGVVKKKDPTKVNYNRGGYYSPYEVPEYGLGGFLRSILDPIADGFAAVAKPIGNLIRPVFDVAGNLVEGVSDVFTGGGDTPDFNIQDRPLPERDPVKKREIPVQQAPQPIPVKGSVNVRQKDKSPGKLREGDFVGNKPSPYVTTNVQDELDYAQEGMRMPEIGMQMTNPMTEPEIYNHGGYYSRQVNQALAINQLSGLVANTINNKKNSMAKGGKFKPHMMYDPKTGKGYMANKLQDHLDMKEKGYDHRKRNPKNYPKGAKGMKMKSYTKGGRL